MKRPEPISAEAWALIAEFELGRAVIERLEYIMLSLEKLNASTAALEASTSALVTAIQAAPIGDPGVTQAQIDTLARRLDTVTADLTTASAFIAKAETPKPAALSISPTSFSFAAGAIDTQSVAITGGTAPYSATNLPTGITFNGTALVSDGSQASGVTTPAEIVDSSSPQQSVSITVAVG
jgi:hypothetical protein